jgi:uncharacterized membrane protein
MPMDSVLIKYIFDQGRQILLDNTRWMAWNLFLAVVPMVLSAILFRHTKFHALVARVMPVALNQRHRSGFWWLGSVICLAFLPNAPYILTDIIHFVRFVWASSVWISALVLVPLFSLFLLAGFLAYVISLINLGFYLNHIGLRRYVFTIEIVIHALSAVGVYLGRFLRFNSWDLVTNLDGVALSLFQDVLSKRPMTSIVVIFILVTGLYAVFKPVTLAIAAYYQNDRCHRLTESQG